MLILVLVAWLAASTTEAVTPIPGTRLRLGMTETQLQGLGEFTSAEVADSTGATPRQGDAKFFGVPCRATLYFRDGRLARAHLEATGVAPHALDYVEDQLRRSKLLRECLRFIPGDHVCDWLGAVKIHLEIQGDKLDAQVESPPQPWEAEADSAGAQPAAAEPTASSPMPAAAESTASAPTSSAAAPSVSPPASGATAPSAPQPNATPPAPTPAPATIVPSTRAPSAAAPSAVVPERAAQPVMILPETLRLSLPERNAPSVWPRMTSMPKLVYPDSAKRESVQGIVWVLALVDTDGVVRSTRIDRGIRELNDAALAWVSNARFAPCVRDGRPCFFWIRVAARFTLY